METLQNFGNIPTPPINEVSAALPMIRNPKAQTAGMTQLHSLGFIIQAIATATAPLTDLSRRSIPTATAPLLTSSAGASCTRQLLCHTLHQGHPWQSL
jgi:hypothetical protein